MISGIMSTLGFGKHQMAHILLAALCRRVAVLGCDQASMFEAVPDEIARIKNDRQYRSMLTDIGRLIRNSTAGIEKAQVTDVVLNGLGSVFENVQVQIDDQREFEGDVSMTPELFSAVIQELVKAVHAQIAEDLPLGIGSQPKEACGDSGDTNVMPAVLRELCSTLLPPLESITISALFPDIHNHMTVDGNPVGNADATALLVRGS